MVAGVDEVGRVADRLGVPFAKGGTIVLARTGAQLRRARAEVDDARDSWGRDDLTLLDEAETGAHRAGHPGARRGLHPRLRRHPSRRCSCAGSPTTSSAAAYASSSSRR